MELTDNLSAVLCLIVTGAVCILMVTIDYIIDPPVTWLSMIIYLFISSIVSAFMWYELTT